MRTDSTQGGSTGPESNYPSNGQQAVQCAETDHRMGSICWIESSMGFLKVSGRRKHSRALSNDRQPTMIQGRNGENTAAGRKTSSE